MAEVLYNQGFFFDFFFFFNFFIFLIFLIFFYFFPSPLSVAVDAAAWQFYTSGILTSCGNTIDHSVQVTGYGTAQRYFSKKK